MKICIADDYAALSKMAANDLVALIDKKAAPLLCTASGDSPAGLYKELVKKVNNKEWDVNNCFFLGLDEWVGLNADDEGSCRYHLNNQLFHPMQIANNKIMFVDGRAINLKHECEKTEQFIVAHGGMDVAIVGLGINGHIGMNEPGTSIRQRTHVSILDPVTVSVGQKYFKKLQPLTKGLTLGLGTLMDAKQIMLLVSGTKKAAIVQQVLEGPITENVPGSLLRNHPQLSIYLDKEAAQFLKLSNAK